MNMAVVQAGMIGIILGILEAAVLTAGREEKDITKGNIGIPTDIEKKKSPNGWKSLISGFLAYSTLNHQIRLALWCLLRLRG